MVNKIIDASPIILLGIAFILIGFKIIMPFKKEKADKTYEDFGWLFKYGGIGMLLWGIIIL